MRILVIGGTRFIGRQVVNKLVKLGQEVHVFHRGNANPPEWDGVRHIIGDRGRLADHASELRELRPSVVLDMIAMQPRQAEAVVETFRGAAERTVVVSSIDVYRSYGLLIGTETGEPVTQPLAETAPLRTRLYPYRSATGREAAGDMEDYDKIPIEQTILGCPELPGTVIRLPMVYGPNDRQHRTSPYLLQMDAGRPAIIVSDQLAAWRWTRGYVENIADAVVSAVMDGTATGRIYNAGEPSAMTTLEWVKAIAAAAGWRGEIVVLPDASLPEYLRAGMNTAHDLVVDTTAIRRELGYREAVPVDAALAATIAWERANPPMADPANAPDYELEDRLLAERVR